MSNINAILQTVNTAMAEAVANDVAAEAKQNVGQQFAAYATLIAAENALPGTIDKQSFDCSEDRLAKVYGYFSNGGSKDDANDARRIFRSVLAPVSRVKLETHSDVEHKRDESKRVQMANRGITLACVLHACEVTSKDRDKAGNFMVEPRFFMRKGDTFVEMVVYSGRKPTVYTDAGEVIGNKDHSGKAYPMNGMATLYVRRTVGKDRKLLGIKLTARSLLDAHTADRAGNSGLSLAKCITYLAKLQDNVKQHTALTPDLLALAIKADRFLQDAIAASEAARKNKTEAEAKQKEAA